MNRTCRLTPACCEKRMQQQHLRTKFYFRPIWNAPPRRPHGVDVASTRWWFAERLSACREFEKEASQKQREAMPVLDRVKLAEETVEAAEDQVKRAQEHARSADEQLRAAVDQLRSAAARLSHPA